ncbi:hypothetical protein J4E08_17310 [Sagittula sp. NFXS13]|uniref:hypothetical protein n=1 Tax=Sagittula sp. NFXS13 TaxID=2819095 RepID=UPI0032DF114B
MTTSDTHQGADPRMAEVHHIMSRARPEQIRRLLDDIRQPVPQQASRSETQ